MEERFGKMTVDVWIGLPSLELAEAEGISDEKAGLLVLQEIGEGIATAAMFNAGSAVVALEITTHCAQVTADDMAALEERGRVERERIEALVREHEEQEATV